MSKFGILMTLTAVLGLGVNAAHSDSAGQDDAVDVAKATLAGELHVPVERIQLTSAHAAEWSDSSLGCPKKGMRYLPVITPGFIVELTVDERPYTVHVGGRNAVVCAGALERLSYPQRSSNALERYRIRSRLV
jgi:hypothetical protein